MAQTALQTLIDNGLAQDKLRDICNDLVACDEMDNRFAVLMAYLLDDGNDAEPSDIDEIRHYDNGFEYGGAEFLVLTDDEADTVCGERIEESLWAFNAEFLSGMTRLPCEVFTALQDQCESANDTVYSIIKGSCGVDEFVNAAASADGRGHFIASYDGEEHEVYVAGTYFHIYRIN